MKRVIVLAAMAGFLSFPHASAQSAPNEPLPPATQFLLQRLHPNSTIERYLQVVRSEFRQADADADGLVKESDAAVHAAMQGAAARMMFVLMVMRADLDGDGAVTEDEIRRLQTYEQRTQAPSNSPVPSSVQNQIDQQVRELMAADANKDGRVTYDELVRHSKQNDRFSGNSAAAIMSQRIRFLLAFAPEGKNAVALADIEPKAEALFVTVDADKNGTVTAEELRVFRGQPQQPGPQAQQASEQAAKIREERVRHAEAEKLRKEQEERAGCEMPKASESAKVVVLSAYQADALSNVTIGSQDVGTGTGVVNVEAGSEPLYVVMVTFRPVIWRFTGAVQRIERVVLAGHNTRGNGASKDEVPLTGLTGISKDRVTFLQKYTCLGYFTETPSTQAAGVAARVRRDTGKEPVTIGANYGVSEFEVPSGKFRGERDRNSRPTLVIRKPAGTLVIEGEANIVVEAGRMNNLRSDILRFYPGGIFEIDPATVVSSRPAELYDVLPNQAGLLQLVQAGSLRQNRSGEFLIAKKIRFPAELHGAHSARFLLLKGVPAPDGDPGHSCVILEENGEPLGGRRGAIC